jgi:hypothetical protein
MPQGEPPGPPMPDAKPDSTLLTQGNYWGDPKAEGYGVVWAGDPTSLRAGQDRARREYSRRQTGGPREAQAINTTASMKPGATVIRCHRCDVGNSPVTFPQGNGTVLCAGCAGGGDLFNLVDDPTNPPILPPRGKTRYFAVSRVLDVQPELPAMLSMSVAPPLPPDDGNRRANDLNDDRIHERRLGAEA